MQLWLVSIRNQKKNRSYYCLHGREYRDNIDLLLIHFFASHHYSFQPSLDVCVVYVLIFQFVNFLNYTRFSFPFVSSNCSAKSIGKIVSVNGRLPLLQNISFLCVTLIIYLVPCPNPCFFFILHSWCVMNAEFSVYGLFCCIVYTQYTHLFRLNNWNDGKLSISARELHSMQCCMAFTLVHGMKWCTLATDTTEWSKTKQEIHLNWAA